MKVYILVFVAFSTCVSFAQTHSSPCAFDQLKNQSSISASEKKIQMGLQQIEKTSDIKTIPVVVHVFHVGGSENISDAQIQSQIDVLNEDFGKLPGTNGDGNGVDTKVRFCLAKIDPNGNCTNGIVRVFSSLTNHKTYERSLLKELSFWDNEKYLNLYIVKSITGNTLGYSSFPGGPASEDGAVIRNDYFGKIGTAASTLGRTATHEVGHWFGLYHTFNNGCGTDLCLDGDYVCDTPPTATANFGCSVSNSCSNDSPNVADLIANYMDYTDDPCKNMLTQGQADRILSTLTVIRSTIWSDSNLISTGCDTNYVSPPSCPIVANFSSLNTSVCLNNSVYFTDVSLNNATNWQWYFPGGTPSTSTLQNPTVSYSILGNFDVSLVVSNATSSDSTNKINFVSVSNPGVGLSLPYQENFDSNVFPPSGITINNPDGGISWELDSAAYISSFHSVKINNLINTNYGTIDEIILPFLNLSTNTSTPYLKYKWAYAKSDALYSDEMIVQLSIDCGVTWNQIFYRTGTSLTTGPTQTTPFIPTASQWKSANVSLASYSSEQYVLIKIVNVTDGGNNLYIDDINISEQTLEIDENNLNESNIVAIPNPASTEFRIQGKFDYPAELMIEDATGKLERSIVLENIDQTITIHEHKAGIYFYRILSSDSKFHVGKLIVK